MRAVPRMSGRRRNRDARGASEGRAPDEREAAEPRRSRREGRGQPSARLGDDADDESADLTRRPILRGSDSARSGAAAVMEGARGLGGAARGGRASGGGDSRMDGGEDADGSGQLTYSVSLIFDEAQDGNQVVGALAQFAGVDRRQVTVKMANFTKNSRDDRRVEALVQVRGVTPGRRAGTVLR